MVAEGRLENVDARTMPLERHRAMPLWPGRIRRSMKKRRISTFLERAGGVGLALVFFLVLAWFAPGRLSAAQADLDRGTDAPPDLWVSQDVSPNRLYVNEPAVYTIRFGRSVKIADASVEKPALKEFVVKNFGAGREYEETVQGVACRVTEMQFLLFPQKAGTFDLPGVRVVCDVVGFSGGTVLPFQPPKPEKVEIISTAVSIKIRPLPSQQGKGDFSGLVGRYSIDANLSRRRVAVGDGVTLTFAVKGKGNIDRRFDLVVPEVQHCRMYRDAADIAAKAGPGGISGSQTHRWVLIASKPGQYSVPAVSLTYFDPGLEAYQTVSTSPMSFEATLPRVPAAGQAAASATVSGPAEPKAPSEKISAPRPAAANGSTDRYLVWLLVLCLPLSLAILLVRRGRRIRSAVQHTAVDTENALVSLRRALAALPAGEMAEADFSDCLRHVFREYLGSILGESVQNRTAPEVADLLAEHAVERVLIESTTEILEALDRVSFSNGPVDASACLLAKAVEDVAVGLGACRT